MPPVTMTREEYQRKYGVAPVLPSTSKVDTTPAPRRMTMAEYQSEYGKPEKVSGFKQAINSVKELYGGGEYGIANKLKEDIKSGAKDIEEGKRFKGNVKAGFRVAGDVAGAVFAPIGAAVEAFPGFAKAKDAVIEHGFNQKGGLIDTISNIPAVQRFAMKHPNAGEDFNRASNLIIGKEANAKISPKTMLPRTVEGIKTTADNIKQYRAESKAKQDVKVTQSIADEIANVENNYSKLRKNNEFSKDADASRKRIAESDALVDAVDKTGTISTKNAIEAYRKKNIEGRESVVRDNLARLGEKVNLAKVERDLSIEIANSGLEGADLITALNGVKKEIAGLKLRADEFGDILLEKVHDAKISTTKNIDFNTPPETKTYRKAVARAYKTIVEENSSFNVGEVNKELSKYYEDISRLEALDGRKVRGGKLGKYTAQIAGNIAGGAVGGAIGGLPGAAIGTIVGGETASMIKGRGMASTFGKERGLEVPKNEILEKAKAESKLPPEKDLRTPSPKVGAPKAIQKTKEVFKLENDIRKNVDAQAKAIKAGDFTLVAKLKEIYDHLVAKLKEVIKKIKETPNKEGGFVKLGSSTKDGNRSSPQSQQKSSSTNDTTEAYKGEKDLTTKILKDLEGKTTVSKQYILDATNRGELKQVERDLIRQVLDDMNPKKADGYTMSHRPSEGVRAFNLTEKVNGEEMIPKDMYEKWYGSRGTTADKESIAVLKAIKDKPEASVTIYRASPKPDFNDGDWVSLSKEYATEHATGNGTKVHSKVVKAKDLKWAMDDVNEFGYYPEKSDTINVKEFADKVKSELLPLKVRSKSARLKSDANADEYFANPNKYENIALPDELRGSVKNYKENIYESPIKTSAGDTHFSGQTDSYFGHTRIEDMADNKTRRVIEVQSDLYQKGNLEKEGLGYKNVAEYNKDYPDQNFGKADRQKIKDVQKLSQYNDPTAHFRMVREEIKKAAQDGKTKLQFPTGETAMKIEGLGDATTFYKVSDKSPYPLLNKDTMKVGDLVNHGNSGQPWIITDVLGDGKFKAVPKNRYEYRPENGQKFYGTEKEHAEMVEAYKESFDISGKVDTNNPIYKFYEKDVQKYLNKFGGKPLVDENGVKWIEVPIKKEWAKMPVEAFALLATLGLGQDNGTE